MKRVSSAIVVLATCSLTMAGDLPSIERFSVANMDPTADPGADFYEFANGGWMKTHEIPPDQTSWSPTNQLIERNAYLIRQMLESCSTADPSRDAVTQQVGDFYAAAMDIDRIEKLGIEPIKADLQRIAGLASKKELTSLLADFHERGIQAFFDVSVSPDERKSNIYALQLSQGGLGLPDRDYYFAKQFAKEREAYRKHIERMMKLIGKPDAEIAHEVEVILEIETKLAQASKPLEELEDPLTNYHKFSIEGLVELAPAIGWHEYLEGTHAAKCETVLVGQPRFFKALNALIKVRSLDDLKCYLRWQLLIATAPLLDEAAQQESFAFYGTVLQGQPTIQPRWKRAARRVDECLGEALGKLYVDRYFSQAARDRMLAMVENIKGVYRDRLANVPWMTPETREKALQKFARFSAKIGAPERYRDYSSIPIRRDDYLGNVQRAEIFESRRQMARIGHEVDRSEWEMTPTTVNAYFTATMNEIVFPAGILQPPFFDNEMDDAVNYGETGATIGHELTHGYDSEGRKYDGEGNLKDWWTKRDVAEFEKRSQKLVTQFNAYSPLPGLHVNGKLTLAENIADLGGLSIAFEALERFLAANPDKRRTIDGYTPEQRFFIAYAQSWACKIREESLRQSLTTDSHSPERIRAFAPLMNLDEFYDAFGVKEGAPLYRPKNERAKIW